MEGSGRGEVEVGGGGLIERREERAATICIACEMHFSYKLEPTIRLSKPCIISHPLAVLDNIHN